MTPLIHARAYSKISYHSPPKEEIHSGVEEINSKTFLPGDTTGETISSGLLNFQKSAAGMAHFNYSETPTGGDP